MQETVLSKSAIEESSRPGELYEVLECPLCGGIQASEHLKAPDRFHWRQDVYTLLRCRVCSGVWLDSPPKPSEMGIHYDEDYHEAITAAGENFAGRRWQRQRDIIC